MHSCSVQPEDGGGMLVAIAALVTEGRIPAKLNSKSKTFYQSPHCDLGDEHRCDLADGLCSQFDEHRSRILSLWKDKLPLCIDVLLTCGCDDDTFIHYPIDELNCGFVLEQWYFEVESKRSSEPLCFNVNQLMSAIRSQLYFSQITAWLTTQDENSLFKITNRNLCYCLSSSTDKFVSNAVRHEFPLTEFGDNMTLKVKFFSSPRMSNVPSVSCAKCTTDDDDGLVDDRMHMSCSIQGKHHCQDFEDGDELIELGGNPNASGFKRLCAGAIAEPSTSKLKHEKRNISPNGEQFKKKSVKLDFQFENDLINAQLKLLDAIERSANNSTNYDKQNISGKCDTTRSGSDIFSIRGNKKNNFNIYADYCDSPRPDVQMKKTVMKMRDISNVAHKPNAKQKITFEDEVASKSTEVPSAWEQAKFRKNLESAASLVFHSRTGLPLTSSPAPVRRGKSCFDFDSTIDSVSAIKSALFSSSFSTDDESESEGSIVSPCSPDAYVVPKRQLASDKYRRKGHANNLLGSFEESVLNGRLEPVSTVHGFKAELGASGSFVPKHLVVPVTVFFYTLGDNDKVSSPYLSHINLGKKGYNVPKSGTVQVTLFNPLGTVVKMFVIMYDLSDMPANSQTFLRQRTLYMPANCKDRNLEWGPKWLRYLIHLRFMTSKSGKVYLHSDVRMIIFRKCDMDTATAHGIDMSYELRSFTHMPTNPKFSPRK